VQILLRKLECAGGMEQRSKNAVAKDVQNKLRKVECALSMEQSSNDAVEMDVQIMLGREECAVGMGHFALHRMNLNDESKR